MRLRRRRPTWNDKYRVQDGGWSRVARDDRGLIVLMVRSVQFAVEVGLEVGKLVALDDRGVGRARQSDLQASSTTSESNCQRACRTFVRATFAVPTPRSVRLHRSSQSYRGEHRWHVCSESSEIVRT